VINIINQDIEETMTKMETIEALEEITEVMAEVDLIIKNVTKKDRNKNKNMKRLKT